jgi:hypothetical protein
MVFSWGSTAKQKDLSWLFSKFYFFSFAFLPVRKFQGPTLSELWPLIYARENTFQKCKNDIGRKSKLRMLRQPRRKDWGGGGEGAGCHAIHEPQRGKLRNISCRFMCQLITIAQRIKSLVRTHAYYFVYRYNTIITVFYYNITT